MTVDMEGGGQLRFEPEGVLVRCEAVREDDGRGLYKVWLTGAQGRSLLGTLAPEGGALRLRRRVSVDSLRRKGCWPIERGECVLTFAFGGETGWCREAAERRMTDSVLRQAAQGVSALVRGEEGGFRMALPFDCRRPFALVPAFCFARVERVEGRLCAVFCFDGQGRPRMKE